MSTHDLIAKLGLLRERTKFTSSDWEQRGLIPSSTKIVDQMIDQVNACLDELITRLHAESGAISAPTRQMMERDLRGILNRGLRKFPASGYDTEEKDFMADEFQKIASVLGLNIAGDLNSWVHGRFLGAAVGTMKRKETMLTAKLWACMNCRDELSISVTAIRADASATWLIVRCDSCREFNLLSVDKGVGAFDLKGFSIVESLEQDQCDERQANARFEQIRYFRDR